MDGTAWLVRANGLILICGPEGVPETRDFNFPRKDRHHDGDEGDGRLPQAAIA